MKNNITINVNQWLSEANDVLNNAVEDAINDKQKIHITAPIGSGKTTFAIETIEAYVKKGYTIVLLEPQISIMDQVNSKLIRKGINTFIIKSGSYEDLDKQRVDKYSSLKKDPDFEMKDIIHKLINPYELLSIGCFISTFDSAGRLFKNDYLNLDKTIVIIDETHSVLTDARESFDYSFKQIMDSGCPVIGFSATPLSWVLESILKIDKSYKIKTAQEAKKLYFINVHKYLIQMVVKTIEPSKEVEEKNNSDKEGPIIIYTNNKKDQNQLKQEINNSKELKGKKVAILNRDTRDRESKEVWDYLMEHDALPDDVDIAIINKVAQAGININNTNIEGVVLVGKFDPISLMQYLGRTRNYDGTYEYLYVDYGSDNEIITDENLTEGIDLMKSFSSSISLEQFLSLIRINSEMAKYIQYKNNGSIKPNRCMVANSIYNGFKELKPHYVKKYLENNFSDEIEIEDLKVSQDRIDEIERSNYVKQKAKQREKNRNIVYKMFRSGTTAKYLHKVILETTTIDASFADLLNITENSHNNRNKIIPGKLYVPKTIKPRIIRLLKSAQKVNIKITRLYVACVIYQHNKKDGYDVLVKTRDKKIQNFINGYFFFANISDGNMYVTNITTNLSIGKVLSGKEWKEEISKLLNVGGIKSITKRIVENIYTFILNFESVKENGVWKKKLVGTNTSFTEFAQNSGLSNLIKYFDIK